MLKVFFTTVKKTSSVRNTCNQVSSIRHFSTVLRPSSAQVARSSESIQNNHPCRLQRLKASRSRSFNSTPCVNMPQTKIPISPATLISSTAHPAPGKLLVTELFFHVPLDHAKPEGEKIRIFCRAAEKLDVSATLDGARKKTSSDPPTWFVFINGGPGFGAPQPGDAPLTKAALDKGYKVLMFDHRGMGLSQTITARTLEQRTKDPVKQAEYLALFRADNAVRDLEAIRLCLTSNTSTPNAKWTIYGQSYGGFVALTYMSFYPEGLKEVFSSGGMAPIKELNPDEPYNRIFKKVKSRNMQYYAKFPEDVARVEKLCSYLTESKEVIVMPGGGLLDAQRFLAMGMYFGATGGFETVHAILLRAANDLEMFGFFTRLTLAEIEAAGPAFDNHILYALLHEPLYCQGQKAGWSASRFENNFLSDSSSGRLFTAEAVFRGCYASFPELCNFQPVAEILEAKEDWPDLYDVEQLERSEVPLYAAIFVDDPYVTVEFAMETAELIRGCKTLVTNQMYHDAVRAKSDELFKTLFDLRDDVMD